MTNHDDKSFEHAVAEMRKAEAEMRKLVPAVCTAMGIEDGPCTFTEDWWFVRFLTVMEVMAKLLAQLSDQECEIYLSGLESELRDASRRERADIEQDLARIN
jgi:hypothetical protein